MSADEFWGQVQALMAAWSSHAYVLVGAIVVGLLVTAWKQGWLGPWLAKVPAKCRPWLALGIGVLGMVAAQVRAGGDWKRAVLMGLYSAALAVMTHQVGVEGLRGGRELLPRAPWGKGADQPPKEPVGFKK